MTRVLQAAERDDLQITAERDIREMLCTQLRLVDKYGLTISRSIPDGLQLATGLQLLQACCVCQHV